MLRRSLFSRRTIAYASAGTVAVAGGSYYFLNSGPAFPVSTRESRKPPPSWLPPSRAQNLNVLKASGSGDDDTKLDLLIVGGGATGAGVAVDAASRGLKVALVERDDFSSGMAPYIDGDQRRLKTARGSPL
jgi:glycerol-3-phosphate dehydrogenase